MGREKAMEKAMEKAIGQEKSHGEKAMARVAPGKAGDRTLGDRTYTQLRRVLGEDLDAEASQLYEPLSANAVEARRDVALAALDPLSD